MSFRWRLQTREKGTLNGRPSKARRGPPCHQRARAPVLPTLERRRAERGGAVLLRGRVPPCGDGPGGGLVSRGGGGRPGAPSRPATPRRGGELAPCPVGSVRAGRD